MEWVGAKKKKINNVYRKRQYRQAFQYKSYSAVEGPCRQAFQAPPILLPK